VTIIGKEAFKDCSSLESVTIPNGVVRIDDRAFRNCPCLKSITIPDSITSIENDAFDKGILLTFTSNGNHFLIKLDDDWCYDKDEICCLNSFIFKTKDVSKRKIIFSDMKKACYRLPLAIFMAISEEEDVYFQTYVRKNIGEAMQYLIDFGDAENVVRLLALGAINKEDIDKFAEYATEKRRHQIWIILLYYKKRFASNHFPESDGNA
jgi:hypothetical protein